MRRTACLAALLLVGITRVAAQEPLRLIDAVQSSIAQHPQLRIQEQQVEVAQGQREQASAPFNDVLAASLDRARQYSPFAYGVGLFSLTPTSTSSVNTSLTRLLRNGITVQGGVSLQRTVESASLPTGLTLSHTGAAVTLPFARGRGREVTTASERAAALTVDSSQLDLRQARATLITRVVTSYWSLLAAQRNLSVATASVARGDVLVEMTRALINADQTPRADLASALANQSDRAAARVAAEQAVVDARQQLILDMGVRPEDGPPATALDEFPPLTDLPELSADDLHRIAASALDRRADYVAEKTRRHSAQVTFDASRNGLQPQVDLTMNVGYSALAGGQAFDRYFAGLSSGVQGLDVVGQITYQFPLSNSQAVGRVQQAQATYKQEEQRVGDLSRSIASSVIATYSALRNAIQQLRHARDSVTTFQTALDGERDKLTLGVGSIVNLLTIEDRLTTASQREVDAWRIYSQALIQFRYATGTLVPISDAVPVLDANVLTTLPDLTTDRR
jgi:outer membrane protein TolC